MMMTMSPRLFIFCIAVSSGCAIFGSTDEVTPPDAGSDPTGDMASGDVTDMASSQEDTRGEGDTSATVGDADVAGPDTAPDLGPVSTACFEGDVWQFRGDEPRMVVEDCQDLGCVADACAVAPVLAYWPMDSGEGDRVWDQGGADLHGTITEPSVRWDEGIRGTGLTFDGVRGGVDLPTWAAHTYADFTFSVWFRSSATADEIIDDGYIFFHSDGLARMQFGLSDGIGDGGSVRGGVRLFYRLTGDEFMAFYHGPTDVHDQQWHHLVAVRRLDQVRLYIDGTLDLMDDDQRRGDPVVIDGNAQEAKIGEQPASGLESPLGTIDELVIFDGGLTSQQVCDLYKRYRPEGVCDP